MSNVLSTSPSPGAGATPSPAGPMRGDARCAIRVLDSAAPQARTARRHGDGGWSGYRVLRCVELAVFGGVALLVVAYVLGADSDLPTVLLRPGDGATEATLPPASAAFATALEGRETGQVRPPPRGSWAVPARVARDRPARLAQSNAR